MYNTFSNSNSKFTTTGIRVVSKNSNITPPVTRTSYPKIKDFETNYLFPNEEYLTMSGKDRKKLQEDVQYSFFDWMFSNRLKGITTTSEVKGLKYLFFVNKHISAMRFQYGPFYFLGESQKPIFYEKGDAISLRDDDENVSTVAIVDGVIPYSHSLQNGGITYSNPLHDENFSDEDGSENEESSMCFMWESPAPVAPVAPCVERIDPMFFEMLAIPDVADTLHEISEIQGQIADIINHRQSYDASIGPNVWLHSKYPYDALELVFRSEE